jgi:TRAP-type C4-dicarboxylate transport system permease small subunit
VTTPAVYAGVSGRRHGAHALFTAVCARLSKLSLVLAVVALIIVVLCVQAQVIGRYVLNDTPTWTEAVAMLLELYITALGVAVGVRDAGHIGLESLVSLLPEAWRRRVELLIHALVALFGGLMVTSGWLWTTLKWSEPLPMLAVPAGLTYLPLVISGALIVLFSVEHVIALLLGIDVEPAWN